MWYEAMLLTALSVGAVMLYTGVGISTETFVRLVGGGRRRGADAHEKTRPQGSSASLASALIGLGLALLGALTLYLVASRLRG
ncbi:MAG TPA: hypothetical protein VGV59_04580 [Pyrinomonadaceae bacterium]|nr:hypothetical protein [Pyrinomonadaceae bacterium]